MFDLFNRSEKPDEFIPRQNSSWKKLKLLIWKNYTIQMRHKWQTLLEVLIPIIFTLGLVVMRIIIKPEDTTDSTMYPPLPVTKPPYNTIWRWYEIIISIFA